MKLTDTEIRALLRAAVTLARIDPDLADQVRVIVERQAFDIEMTPDQILVRISSIDAVVALLDVE